MEYEFPMSFLDQQEMRNQLRMKDERLNDLQKENQTLRISLEKLQTAVVTIEAARNPPPPPQSFYAYVPPPPPIETPKPKETPLWLLNDEILERQQAFTEAR